MRPARRALEALYRLVHPAQLEQRSAKVVLRLGPIGRDLERTAETARGRGVFAALRLRAPGGVPRPCAPDSSLVVCFSHGSIA